MSGCTYNYFSKEEFFIASNRIGDTLNHVHAQVEGVRVNSV